MATKADLEDAKKLWTFLFQKKEIQNPDGVVVLCSHDLRIANFAAQYFLKSGAKYLVFSGGLSPFTARIFGESEAKVFSEAAIAAGVSRDVIIQEDKSTNTQENLQNTEQLLKSRGVKLSRRIYVQKPNMLRRVAATVERRLPGSTFGVTSHDISFSEISHEHAGEEMLIHEFVGDVQRLRVYSERGLIAPVVVPDEMWEICLSLQKRGYVGNLVM